MRRNSITRFIFLGIFLLLVAHGSGYGQEKRKKQLENEKEENLKKIEQAKAVLEQTQSKRKATLGQLNALNEQINAREELISSINKELSLLKGEIDELTQVITSLEEDLKKLKDEYAGMIYLSYKVNNSQNKLMFLFSASTFYDFYRRLQYMDLYANARKKQAKQINLVADALIRQRDRVKSKRNEKQSLLQQEISQNTELRNLKEEQKDLVAKLNTREKELRQEVKDREKAVERLNKLIADIVKKEIERSKSREENKIKLNATESELAKTFAEARNKLIWPVKYGFITSKFGRHPHAILHGVEEENQGVDIQTNQNEQVRAVFDGTVKAVAIVPGEMRNVVLVQHGDYFTVYAKLGKVYVKSGQKVNAREAIGEVHTNKDGVAELQFQVWRNKEKLDPQTWLVKNN